MKPYLLVLFLLLFGNRRIRGKRATGAAGCFGVLWRRAIPKLSKRRPPRQRHPGVGRQLLRRKRSDPGRRFESAGGSVFKVTPSGQFTLLHTFPAGTNNNYPSGNPPGFLAEGSDGNLYGTTLYGGSHNGGVLFRISKTGTGFN